MNSIALTIPGSKSITNRALLLSALAEGSSVLRNVLFSDDTRAMMRALHALGVELFLDEARNEIKVRGCAGVFPQKQARIDCQEAGTVARFLLVACANQVGDYEFVAKPRLCERPFSDLVNVLRAQGAEISADALPLRVTNSCALAGGEIFVPSHVSSQFLSGLMMMAPFFQRDTTLVTQDLVSEPYVKMTLSMMQRFSIRGEKGFCGDDVEMNFGKKQWHIKLTQKYHSRDYWIESDFSSASYFFAAAAITGKTIILRNMFIENSLQGDSAFLQVLEKMGCDVDIQENNIVVTGPTQLRGIEVDMKHMPDVMMTLAAIAPFANSPTRIFNVGNARVKESDRISVMAENLCQLGVQVEEEAAALTIYPSMPRAGCVKSYNDHRIAMAFAVLRLRVPGVVIDDVACVSKTFPGFFEMFKRL